MEANEKKEHYIREHMTAVGVGIVELARRLGQTRQNVYIQIDKSSITLQTLHRIANALGIEAYRLLLPPDDTRQPRNTQQQERKDKQREGRKGGRREGHGWPRAWRVEEGNKEEHGSRQGAGRERKKRDI